MKNLDVKSENLQTAPVRVSNPNGLSAVYANCVGVGSTMVDFTLLFTEVGQIPNDTGAGQKNELKTAVTMPILLAQAVIEGIQQMLKVHQEQMKANAAGVKGSQEPRG